MRPAAEGKGATDPRAADGGGGATDPRAADGGGGATDPRAADGGTKDPRNPTGTGGGKLGARPVVTATGGLDTFELATGLATSPAGAERIPLSEGVTPGFGIIPLDAESLITSPPLGYVPIPRRHCF